MEAAMFMTTSATQVEVVEGFLTPQECAAIIDANRWAVDKVVGPVRATTPVRKPSGQLHYPECRWRGSVHAAGEYADLGGVDLDRVWQLAHELNELKFRWRIPLFDGSGVGRFGV